MGIARNIWKLGLGSLRRANIHWRGCCMQDPAEEWVQADDFAVKAKVQHLRKSFPQVRPELLKTLLKANQGNITIVKQVGCCECSAAAGLSQHVAFCRPQAAVCFGADGRADTIAAVLLQALHASAKHPAGLGSQQRRTGGKGRRGRGQSPAGTVPRNGSDPAPSRVVPASRTPPAGKVVQYSSYEQARDRQQNQAIYNVSHLQGRPVSAEVLVPLLCLTGASHLALCFVLPAVFSPLQLLLGTCPALHDGLCQQSTWSSHWLYT